MKNKIITLGFFLFCSMHAVEAKDYDFPFQNPALPVEERVEDLISRLTLQEKVQMMKHQSPAIERLGVPAYNWWNEALHGVARTSEKVTALPASHRYGGHIRYGCLAKGGRYDFRGGTCLV